MSQRSIFQPFEGSALSVHPTGGLSGIANFSSHSKKSLQNRMFVFSSQFFEETLFYPEFFWFSLSSPLIMRQNDKKNEKKPLKNVKNKKNYANYCENTFLHAEMRGGGEFCAFLCLFFPCNQFIGLLKEQIVYLALFNLVLKQFLSRFGLRPVGGRFSALFWIFSLKFCPKSCDGPYSA